ncbi:MAG: hypothetical protein ACJ772_08530 [Gemmatimonadaceae bacterium]
MPRIHVLVAALCSVVAATSGTAQNPIAQRVSRAPDGVVRVQFASRPGTCGDGRDLIGYRKAFFAESMQSFGGHWTAEQCVPGPVRVALTVTGGRVTQLKTYVGGSWSGTTARVTDLGTVSASDAAAYFFELVPQLEGRPKRDRLLIPAVLADDQGTVPRLIALARDGSRAQETRRQAIQWIGLVGDASVVPTLVAFARQDRSTSADDDDDDDHGPGEDGIATAAVAALSFLENGVGVPALIDMARNGSSKVRISAVFWLGQTGDARAISTLHTIIDNAREKDSLRARAIFALSHGDDIPAREFAYLREIYPRLSSLRLKDAVLMGMAEDHSRDASAWLIAKASDETQSVESRKKAIFWAGQRDATPTSDLVAYYRATRDRELREHTLFVLSQRDDDAAITELLRIAREDSDKQMRGRALFWLGQKDDPRVTKLISDRLSK